MIFKFKSNYMKSIFHIIYDDVRRTRCKCVRVFKPYKLESICPEYCLPKYLKPIHNILKKKPKSIVNIIMSYLLIVRTNESVRANNSYMTLDNNIF